MGKLVGVVALFCVATVLSVAVLVSAVIGGATAPSGTPTPATSGTAADRAPALPAGWVDLDRVAAATCSGLSWSILAAIGTVESDNGQSSAPGVASGANAAGAEGPMQFEPATFAAYATDRSGRRATAFPYDPVDAVYTAATCLCANGGGTSTGLRGAVFAYNHDVRVRRHGADPVPRFRRRPGG